MSIAGSSSDSRGSSRQPLSYVLVVDDDPDARMILTTILDPLDVPVKEAEDGQIALDMILEEKPSLILLDLMMPGMDGFSLLSRLQAMHSLRHIPVIVVSALSADEANWYRLPGVEDILQKGRYSIQELQDKAKALLDR